MIGNAQAQMYANEYSYKNNYYQDGNRYSYDKKDPKSSHTDIQKIKCVNSNINDNGIDVSQIPQDATVLAATNEGGAATADAANTQNGNGLTDRINVERNLVNICVNVNDNEQTKVSPPPDEEPTANLSVSKTVTCDPGNDVQNGVAACTRVTTELTPNVFSLQVAGNNPNPDTFDGLTVPVIVTLGLGNYELVEIPEISIQTIILDIQQDLGVGINGNFEFSRDCTEVLNNPLVATGTIASGESDL